MSYKYEDELRKRAEQFIEALAQVGIEGAIVSDSFRDYLVKVSIHRSGQSLGQVNLYYSPRKGQFSLKSHELREKVVVPDLEACWDRFSSPEHTAPVQTAAATEYEVYVDGSYLEDAIGYGVVVLKDGKPVAELNGAVQDEALQGMRQVGGELQAIYKAIEWCQANGIGNATICYDYAGIEKWATGAWKANTPATQAYAAYMQELPLALRWQKVESHSGDRWNDRADQLAKLGARQDILELGAGEDTLIELGEKAGNLAKLLEEHGIPATYQGIHNNQYARVVVAPPGGCVDLYSTPKRSVSQPYLHGFLDNVLQERIKDLWQGFLSGQAGDGSRTKDFLKEVTYYYEILRPYHDCAFDFSDLASALDRACRHLQRPGIDVESSRYEFEKLEAMYHNLQGGKAAS